MNLLCTDLGSLLCWNAFDMGVCVSIERVETMCACHPVLLRTSPRVISWTSLSTA